MKLYVEGKLKTRSWEKDGQIRRKTEVIAENVQILYRPEQYKKNNDEVSATESLNEEQEEANFNDIF
ncbi:MAG: single-stranded DNA-binding protein, partial [Paludibacteraceae bacterium]|nr:single-stranded DNA-binding protein [Paludibacteraceae bacterium]